MVEMMQMKRRMHKALSGRERGATLIEVLVAMLVTTIGLVGFAGLQVRAINAAEETYARTQAMSLAQELLERKRINGSTERYLDPDAVDAGLAVYTTAANWTGTPPSIFCNLAASNCDAATMARFDIIEIRRLVQSNNFLPNGSMLVTQAAADGLVNIFVAWGDTTAQECADGGGVGVPNCVSLQGV